MIGVCSLDTTDQSIGECDVEDEHEAPRCRDDAEVENSPTNARSLANPLSLRSEMASGEFGTKMVTLYRLYISRISKSVH